MLIIPFFSAQCQVIQAEGKTKMITSDERDKKKSLC